jgi:tRNA G10  N-methylase Trm11
MEEPPAAVHVLLVAGGLEDVAADVIREELAHRECKLSVMQQPQPVPNGQKLYYRFHSLKLSPVNTGYAGLGRLKLLTNAAPGELSKLRCIQGNLALVAEIKNVGNTQQELVAALAPLRTHAPWTAAIKLWSKYRDYHQPQSGEVPLKVSFRASGIRDGRHQFNSKHLAAEIGGAVPDSMGWSVSMSSYDVEIVGILLHDHLLVGLRLCGFAPKGSRRSTFERKPAAESIAPYKNRALVGSSRMVSLRPSTGTLLARLVEYSPGMVLVDCCCGVGTIPIEACISKRRPLFGLGGEFDPEAVQGLAMNLQGLKRTQGKAGVGGEEGASDDDLPQRCDGCSWDVRRLPLRDGSVDAISVDMPFGVHCGKGKANHLLYPSALREARRVLKKGGQCLMLVTDLWLMSQSLRQPEVPEGVEVSDDGECIVGAQDGMGGAKTGAVKKTKGNGGIAKKPKLPKKEWKRIRKEEMEAALGNDSCGDSGGGGGGGGDASSSTGAGVDAPLPWSARWDVRRVLSINVGGLATYLFDMRKCSGKDIDSECSNKKRKVSRMCTANLRSFTPIRHIHSMSWPRRR